MKKKICIAASALSALSVIALVIVKFKRGRVYYR